VTAQRPTRVLIVDDERNIRKTLSVCLQSMGCEVTETGAVDAARARPEMERRALDLEDRLADAMPEYEEG